MEWKDVEQTLIRLIGDNYINYPKCVEWNIMVLKYINTRRKTQTQILEKVKNGN